MKDKHPNVAFLLLGLLVLLYACSPDDQQDDSYQENLDQNRATWRALSLQSYQYNFHRACFCGPDTIREVMIRYAEGEIESIVYADDLSTPSDMGYPTIEALFDIVQDAINNNETGLVVQYHPQFGYPMLISRDPIPQAVDDEITYRIDQFNINNTLHTAVILTSDLNFTPESAEFEVSDAVIKLAGSNGMDFDTLHLTINTISSCGSSYFRFYVSTALMKSLPPQAQTKVVRLPLADDVCDMPQSYQVSVNLTPYRQELINSGVSEVILHIASFSISYTPEP